MDTRPADRCACGKTCEQVLFIVEFIKAAEGKVALFVLK
jgi:hypothetical protein